MPDTPVVELATSVSEELLELYARLLPQLSATATASPALLEAVTAAEAVHLLVARLHGTLVGMCTLATFPTPTGVRAWIEDVVVDETARGGGVGRRLVEAALEHAGRCGARTVDLTSRPSRQAANRLYERVGFARRETNLYRITLES